MLRNAGGVPIGRVCGLFLNDVLRLNAHEFVDALDLFEDGSPQ